MPRHRRRRRGGAKGWDISLSGIALLAKAGFESGVLSAPLQMATGQAVPHRDAVGQWRTDTDLSAHFSNSYATNPMFYIENTALGVLWGFTRKWTRRVGLRLGRHRLTA